jgi:hypothetical protein
MAMTSEAEVNKALKRILKSLEVMKKQAQERGHAFVGLSREQLIRKLRGETSNSPFFTGHAWDQLTNSGSPSFYLTNYFNPDPVAHVCFVSLFFGLAHLEPDLSSAIAARDTRWPCVSTELAVIGPGELGVAEFTYTVPFAPRGTYFGNSLLWRHGLSEPVGELFERGISFYITLK